MAMCCRGAAARGAHGGSAASFVSLWFARRSRVPIIYFVAVLINQMQVPEVELS